MLQGKEAGQGSAGQVKTERITHMEKVHSILLNQNLKNKTIAVNASDIQALSLISPKYRSKRLVTLYLIDKNSLYSGHK